MKILYISNHNSKFHNTNFYREKAIEKLKHKIVFFNDKNFKLPGRAREVFHFLHSWDLKRMNNQMVEKAILEKPDLCMIVGGSRVFKETIDKIKDLGIKVVLWTSDVPIIFDNILRAAKSYDFIFCSGTEAIEIFKENGISNVQWIPFGCDPEYHRPMELTQEDKKLYAHDCIFVGSHYPNRAKTLNVLSHHNIGVWGPNWRLCDKNLAISKIAVEKHLDYKEWVKIFSATKINLIIHYNDKKTPCYQTSPHLYEALACKSFVLTDDQKDTQSLFNNQEHLVIFKDVTDLQKKVDYYLKHPEECLKIAENGYQEVLKKHTYRHRLTDILQTIESL